MRHLIVALGLVATSAFAATPPIWGPLQPGPYAVGYRLLDRYDYTRPYWIPRDLQGRLRTFERARPMRISVWYPATPSNALAVPLGDYIDSMGAEHRIASIRDQHKRAGRAARYRVPRPTSATPDQP